jgi:hypothetical protein
MVTIEHRKSNYESHEILIMTKKCGFLFHWYSPLVLRDSYFLIPRFSQKYYILPLYVSLFFVFFRIFSFFFETFRFFSNFFVFFRNFSFFFEFFRYFSKLFVFLKHSIKKILKIKILDFLSFLGFNRAFDWCTNFHIWINKIFPFPKKALINNFFSNKRNFFDVKFFNLTTYFS